MLRILALILFCFALAACGGGSNGDGTANSADNGLNPTTMAVESPPSNGKLPADLLHPS